MLFCAVSVRFGRSTALARAGVAAERLCQNQLCLRELRLVGEGSTRCDRGAALVAVLGAYSGQAYSPCGDKGRFVLPPAFRKAVKSASGGSKTLCLVGHERFNCLVGFGLSRIDKLHEQLDREEERAIRLKQNSFDRDARAGQLFQFEQFPFDDSGRFVMPENLREICEAGDGLFFQGAGDFFFLWSPHVLAQMDSAWRGAQAACKRLVAEAEAKAAKKGGGK